MILPPVPPVRPEVLIVEATYGVQMHERKKQDKKLCILFRPAFPPFAAPVQRDARFSGVVTDVVVGGGKCLIPVFALGRAQELLLMLEEM